MSTVDNGTSRRVVPPERVGSRRVRFVSSRHGCTGRPIERGIGSDRGAAGEARRCPRREWCRIDDRARHDRHAVVQRQRVKGGTTHPYAALRNVVPGRYDPDTGRWIAADGSERVYAATDNLQDDRWKDLPPLAVVGAVADAGLRFEATTGRGVILHMLSGLAIDGRFGLTAIAESPADADAMELGVRRSVEALVA